ncbi:zinc c2h2 type family protein [Stylonychia lemnae]|uniref:Zinc c2h2 type family protein n=1 Tax=Stylonychia lemnae TaxID=5949 RepID=A0A078AAB5_STYLE|nr:zinc c2h2 type family protein [Stylonychia lemnae]|eukprot:CDW79200.1 zinc c2h2 type family protein [Stylonychia lemnae]
MSPTRRSQNLSSQISPHKKSPTKTPQLSQVNTASSIKELKTTSQKGEAQNTQEQKESESKGSGNNTSAKQNTSQPIQQAYNLRSTQSGDRKKLNISEFNPGTSKENIREKSEGVKANKTLNLKSQTKQITTKTPNGKNVTNHHNQNIDDKQSYESPEVRYRFATERINLPRGKVVRCSRSSSANGSRRNSQSPVKLPRNMPPLQVPNFQDKMDYFKEYWRLYFQNEILVADIEQTAHSNYKNLKKIYNLEDYYEHNLIPQVLAYPHKFQHRINQQKLQKQQQQQKLIMQQKQQQELLQQMKSKDGSQPQQSTNNDQSNNNEGSSQGTNGNAPPMTMSKDRMHKRKKHLRRTAAEIERDFTCPYADCGKFYGSEGSLNLHIKIKHNGGNKTEREKLAKTLVQAYINGSINRELDQLDLNLPPGALQKAVKKAGLVQAVSENEILRQISNQLQVHSAAASTIITSANISNINPKTA